MAGFEESDFMIRSAVNILQLLSIWKNSFLQRGSKTVLFEFILFKGFIDKYLLRTNQEPGTAGVGTDKGSQPFSFVPLYVY
jgi:hypothetical protein